MAAKNDPKHTDLGNLAHARRDAFKHDADDVRCVCPDGVLMGTIVFYSVSESDLTVAPVISTILMFARR